MKQRLLYIIGFLSLVFILVGCGYTAHSLISHRVKTIYINPFVNKIDISRDTDTGIKYKLYRPRLETEITQALLNRFILDGNLKPEKKENADLILKGELLEFRKDVLRYIENTDEPEEYRISLVTHISLYDNLKDKLIWEEKNFITDTTYFTTGQSRKSEDTAVDEAIKDLARRIVERVVEDW
ncbi:MAG: LPS assembly lipoprotein LptE [Candidatus Omnitrophica bacterium]|nr:LPS assembly lipoprotein LptE [Candidatus Omnitrophota bacterium]